MKNKNLKKMGISILVGSLIVTPVTTSLCTPMTVYAQEVIDGNCDVNEANGVDNGTASVDENSGTIDINNGSVNTNKGTINTNNEGGNVTSNDGTINTNKGTVTSNASGGTVATNEGTVKTNDGTVTTNKNKVETNNGTVDTNLGVVDSNTGTIKDNFGTVTNNTGTITDNYGDASVEGGTVLNQWVLIETGLDAVNFNMQSDTSTYVGETIRKKQIEGFGTETILDDKEAIYIRFGASAYLFAGDSNRKIIVPDETDENTKEFIDAGDLTYDSTTNKSRLSLQNIESKVISLVFKIIDKNTTPENPPADPETPVVPENPVTPTPPADSPVSDNKVTPSNQESKVSDTTTSQPVAIAIQTPVAVADKSIIAKVPLATVQTTTTSTVQTATVPAATIANLNAAILTNTEAPIVVKSVILQTNNGTDTGSAQTVTATVNATTVNGKIGLSPQLVSGLKETVTSQLGANSSKSVDIKVNTTSADGKPLSIVVNTNNLKNNVTLKAYIVDPKTGGYVLTEIPSVKYNNKTGITLPNLEGGYTYSFVSAKEAKAIENQIEKSVTVSDDFKKPVSSNPGSQVDMSKALSDSLNMANVSKIVYTVSGSKAVIDPVTGQLSVNDNATEGTITVTIKVTLMNGKTKTVKARIKIG